MTLQAPSPMAGKAVVILINRDEGGGVEYLARVLSNELQRQGATCTTRVIYPDSNASTAAKLKRIAEKIGTVRALKPDVLITFQPTASAIAAIAGRASGCDVRIVHQSNSPVKSHPIVRIIDKILGSIGAYSVIIANSRATLNEFEQYPSTYKKRITLIEHGIPPPEHVLSPADIRSKFGLPYGVPILLMAARLDNQKGQNLAVATLSKLPGVHLAMAGSGPEKYNLTALGWETGVLERMHFLGHVQRQDLMDLYRAATLFVFPSTWETFGLAAVEAAMTGLPVVCSDIPALREVLTINNEVTAYFVASRNADAWANVILHCLKDADLRSRCEKFATAIQDKYSERRMMQAYDSLYAELI
jgi:glycosyltransferase involved in cell wall biosynthesis